MKLFLLSILLVSLVAHGQDTLKMKTSNSKVLGGLTYTVPVTVKLSDTSIVEKYNQAFDLYKASKTNKAISIWKDIVATSSDKHAHVYGWSFFSIGDAFFATKRLDSAEVWFKKILASSLLDSTDTEDFIEPFGNYKYLSCKRLSSIYAMREDYMKAIAYIDSAEYNYPYYGFPGSMTSVMEEKATRVWWKAKLYYFDYQDEEALYTLLSEFYKSNYPAFFNESNQFLLEIINEKGISKEYLSELNKALDALTVESKGNSVTGTFIFREKMYEANVLKDKEDPFYFENSPIVNEYKVLAKNEQYFVNKIKGSSIYKILSN